MERGYSKLLIDDFVLPSTEASLVQAGMDFMMMMYASGMERTMKQWQRIIDLSGLEVVNVWGLEFAHGQIIECQLKT